MDNSLLKNLKEQSQDRITNKTREHEDKIEPKEVQQAKTLEKASQYDSKTKLRAGLTNAVKWVIYALAVSAVIVIIGYVATLFLSPFIKQCTQIQENLKELVFKLFDILPWVLLFLFGDTQRIISIIMKKDD